MRGFRGLSPKQIERAMRQLGISVEELENVEEVIIRTASKEYLFRKPSVTVMLVQEQKTYQVAGEPEIKERGMQASDIELVAQQANVTLEQAKKALEATQGDIAEAILKLQSNK
ncbi:MAG: nascent polypeptide-associated complex protein [Candidatus Thermoplasmatota archaeon]|nr:nascent polypeptide-associated complex protein [Candidatus Thermoplasmatota archaeon]MDI6888063.1 nascent polypeptide-associated complex protein [Candidatus Thermoplasmatota archaeon]